MASPYHLHVVAFAWEADLARNLRKEEMMVWLYLLVPFIVLCGAAGVINWRRRRSFSYDSESAAQVARGGAESKLPGH
jgi:hypothetical protein